MYCRNCGLQLPDDSKFCNRCGAPQDYVQPPQQSSASQQSSAPQQNSATQQNSAPQQQAAEPQQTRSQTPAGGAAATAVRPDLTGAEKAFKRYIAPCKARNWFIAMCVIAIPSFVMPPVGIGFAFLAVLIGLGWAVGISRVKKRISAAQLDGTYQQMLQEFSNAQLLVDGKVRYSDNYIWGKASGWFYHYKNVQWIYRHTVSYLFIPIRSEVMIGNQDGKVVPFCKLKLGGQTGGEEIKSVAAVIHKKNPNVLLGYDAAKQAEYKRRTR